MVSPRQTPHATDTLRLATVPAIGIRASSSQCSRVKRRMHAKRIGNAQARTEVMRILHPIFVTQHGFFPVPPKNKPRSCGVCG